MFALEHATDVPLYRQIRDGLRREIEAGALAAAPGCRRRAS